MTVLLQIQDHARNGIHGKQADFEVLDADTQALLSKQDDVFLRMNNRNHVYTDEDGILEVQLTYQFSRFQSKNIQIVFVSDGRRSEVYYY